MTDNEIKHVLRDLTEVHTSVDRAIDWCECADEYIIHDVENRPNLDCGIVRSILTELKNTQCLLQAYMTELEASKS